MLYLIDNHINCIKSFIDSYTLYTDMKSINNYIIIQLSKFSKSIYSIDYSYNNYAIIY